MTQELPKLIYVQDDPDQDDPPGYEYGEPKPAAEFNLDADWISRGLRTFGVSSAPLRDFLG